MMNLTKLKPVAAVFKQAALAAVPPVAPVVTAIDAAKRVFGQDTFVRSVTPTEAARPVATAGTLPPGAQDVLADLRAGKTDDATRAKLAAVFGPAGQVESKAVMDVIRREGLMDTYLAATLRDEHGGPVDPALTEAVKIMMATGRLDVYGEILATVSLNHYDPAGGRFDGNTCYSPGDKGVYFNGLGDPAAMAKTMAHEMFHAYADAHGADGQRSGVSGALNEGFGIAAIGYAFEPDRPLNLAEMVYGTKNWYRDMGVSGHDSDIPLGDAANADPELVAFLETLGSHDRSGLAWNDPGRMQQDYDQFFAGLDRRDPAWFEQAEEATAKMRDAR